MNPSTIEILATCLFGLAILHTFMVKRFEIASHRYPSGSVGENLFHLLAEVEVVFGIWATVFLVSFTALLGGDQAIAYLESSFTLSGAAGPVSIHFTEPLFVFAIMAMAATRPVLEVARRIIEATSRLLPLPREMAFFATCLVVGPILGSFITEPAAMTVTALLLKQRFYDRGMSTKLMYATIGLLFVNVSIGGTLTHFAAPPVVMVAAKWDLDIAYMLTHFGWKAAIAVITGTVLTTFAFRKELAAMTPLPPSDSTRMPVPVWLMVVHLVMIGAVVATSHHVPAFIGIFLLFLGFTDVTREHQDELKLREALLVAYFLMGLVVLGGLQTWWLQPTLTSMNDLPLFFGATGLTALTDNAALTFLGSQVEGLSDASKYALLAGAVTGGGLTVIANAPNPAGYGILKGSFGEDGMSPLLLLLAALPATALAILAFLLLPHI